MLCDACVEIVLRSLAQEAGCPTNMMGWYCNNPECERGRIMDSIHRFTKPNLEARNEYSALKDLSKEQK